MINLLNRYAKTSFDIMTNLPPTLSAMVLSYLRLVSRCPHSTSLLLTIHCPVSRLHSSASAFRLFARLPELLSCELVSTKWLEMCRQEELYELLVRKLTRFDPVPVRQPTAGIGKVGGGWRGLYHALYHRERNWAWGNPQSLK